jgi:hypothetical protein
MSYKKFYGKKVVEVDMVSLDLEDLQAQIDYGQIDNNGLGKIILMLEQVINHARLRQFKNSKIHKALDKMFKALEEDDAITGFSVKCGDEKVEFVKNKNGKLE